MSRKCSGCSRWLWRARQHRWLGAAAVLMALLACQIGVGADVSDAALQEEFELALAALETQTETLRTRPVEYVYSYTDVADLYADEEPQVMHFTCRLITHGAKFRYDERIRFGDAAGPDRAEVVTYDGGERRTFLPGRQKGSVSSGSEPPVVPLALAYFVGEGDVGGFLSDRAERVSLSRRARADGRPLLVVVVEEDDSRYEISLDPDVGYQPRCVAVGLQYSGNMRDASGYRSGAVEAEVTAFRQVDGCFLPSKAALSYRVVTNEGKARTVTRRSLSVEEVRLGVAVSDDTFTIAFPEGTKVLLYDVGETYTAGVTGPR